MKNRFIIIAFLFISGICQSQKITSLRKSKFLEDSFVLHYIDKSFKMLVIESDSVKIDSVSVYSYKNEINKSIVPFSLNRYEFIFEQYPEGSYLVIVKIKKNIIPFRVHIKHLEN
jgi:hypothetical protein